MSQKIIVTTSPWKDYKNNKWMLSAFMSIQLDAGKDVKLSAFPDILKWMEKLQQAKFYVQWNTDQPKDITVKSDKWDADLYGKLFQDNINVKSFAPFDISKLVIKSYPVTHITNFILDTYKDVGNLKTDELPTAKFYTQDYKKLSDVSQVQLKQTQPITNRRADATTKDFVNVGHVGRVTARQQLTQNKAIGFSKVANPNMDFGQFHNFHSKIDQVVAKVPSIIKKPDFEYHDILSIITSYPPIMRKLGLVLDFELPGAPPAANGTVRIMPANLSFDNDVAISCPATSYQYTGKGFYAAAKVGSFIEKGMLKINSDDFSVVQIDTDGAAMKLANHADTVNYSVAKNLVQQSNFIVPIMMFNNNAVNNNANNNPTPNQDEQDNDEGLPSLRSAGIGIVKNGLAQHLVTKFSRIADIHKILINPAFSINNAALFNSTPRDINISQPKNQVTRNISPERVQNISRAIVQPSLIPVATEILYADDIVFGYRLDVAYDDKPATWYSLHKRKNGYAFAPVGQAQQPITLVKDDEIDEGCIHLALTKDNNDSEQDQKVNEVIARWEGWSLSVPRLGKGLNNEGKEVSTDDEEKKKYQLDNDVPFRLQVNINPASKTLPMLRFGKSYRVKIRTVDIAGNSVPHDVVPENDTVAVKSGIKYLRYEPLSAPVLVQGDEVVSGDKNLMRDRDGESIQHMVIRSNYNVSAQQYESNNPTVIPGSGIGQRGTTIIYLHEAVRHVTAPRTSQQMAEVHGMFDEAFSNPAKAQDTYAFIKSRDNEVKDDGKKKADVVSVNNKQVDIDYLADPMAAGVIFTMKSDVTFETSWAKGVSRKFSFYFDDEVTDINANKSYSVDQWKVPRSFRIRMIEGNAAPSWNSSDRMFIISLPKSAQVEINYACYWRPDDLDKASGMQNKVIAGNFTSRAALHARKGLHWMFSPWRTLRLVHAVQQPLEKPVMDKASTKILKDYEDTFVKISTKINVHGSSTDKVDVEANWTEWKDDLAEMGPKQVTGKTHVQTIPVSYTGKELDLFNIGGAMSITPNMLPGLTHSFNDTKHRMVNYTPVATTRYREYFTGIIETAKQNKKDCPLTQVGDTLQLNVLSSARPVLPVVDYVLPSFNWIKTEKGNQYDHLRTGNIRVYVKRPWFSSGDNERLAVILPPRGVDPSQSPVLKKFCTVWGKDPAFAAQDLNNSNYPQIDHFPFGLLNTDPKIANENDAMNTALIYDASYLAEEKTVGVSVAAYKVLFDKEKQLHYADIPIFIGFAYFPFVKLALARYQRHSIRKVREDCCLSNVVHTDWMQVVPARATSVVLERGRNAFTVSLKGVAPFMFNPDKFEAASNNARVKIVITVEDAKFPKTEEAFISINDRQTATYISGKETLLNFRQIINGQINYTERLEIDPQWTTKPYRIIIREYELHEYDQLRAKERAFTNLENYHEYGERLVFMDVFEVNGSV